MHASGAPVRRIESQIHLSAGAPPRHRRAWLADAPERTMILVHGYAEHCGRYDEMAMYFASRGFAVHAYDQSGHGRSVGPRGDVDRFERMLDDLAEFIEFVGEQHKGLPSTLVGHSMGGLVAAATSAFRNPAIDRLVLSGALLEFGADTPAWQKIAARLLAPLGARIGLSVGLDPEGLSRDPEVARRYTADPYVKDRISARFAAGMMRMVDQTSQSAHQVAAPTLVLHGEADPMCPASGSQAFHANLSPAIADQSQLQIYPELRHEIFQEPERHAIWQDILGWLG